ncbi:MAG: hypothetical protein Q4C03_07155 [bacterium]|nr:hypothetical protein [bacterium]
MKQMLLMIVAFGWAALSCGAELPTRFVQAMQRALDADATWTMTKTLPQLSKPLISSGEVSCWQTKGMIWKTLLPWEEEIHLFKTSMTFISEDATETKAYDEMPYYEDICEATDDFLAGDMDAFDDLFDWTWQEGDGGAWTMTLEVEYRQMHRLFKTITLTGNDVLETVTFVSDDESKGKTHLRFSETGCTTHSLWHFLADEL